MNMKLAQMAEVYDDHIQMTIPHYEDFFIHTKSLVQAINPNPQRWLDTGCGTGAMAERALKSFPDTEFYLNDPSPYMLEKARSKPVLQEPRVHIASQPLPTQCLEYAGDFQVITAIQAHHYMTKDERADALANCYHLLSVGGILVVFENIRPLAKLGIEIGVKRWVEYQIRAGKPENEARAHALRIDKEYFPITVEQHLQLLRTTGFKTVEILWVSYMQAGFYAVK